MVRWFLMAGAFSLFFASQAIADQFTAIVTRSEGETQLLTPSISNGQSTRHALYNEKTYEVLPIKVGVKVKSGDVVQTSPQGKVRLIFPNGDQLTIGPGSNYENSGKDSESGKPVFKLFSGQIRAIIKKDGPRTGLEVKTNSTVMGVRGTDFHISTHSKTGGTKISVLRGKVAVQERSPEVKESGFAVPKDSPKGVTKDAGPKFVEILAGQTAIIKTPSKFAEKQQPKIKIASTTKESLGLIQQNSTIAKAVTTKVQNAKNQGDLQDSSQDISQIDTLEKAAISVAIEDIKNEDPILFKSIKEQKDLDDVDQIQTLTVRKAEITAPSSQKSSQKPSEDELDGDLDESYEKYKSDP